MTHEFYEEAVRAYEECVKEDLIRYYQKEGNPHKYKKKAILKVGLDDQFFGVFYPSIKEAARFVEKHVPGVTLENAKSNISKCVRGIKRSAYGFIWLEITEY